MNESMYVGFDARGHILAIEPTAEQAVDDILEQDPRSRIQVEDLDAFRHNPPPVAQRRRTSDVELGLQNCGVRPVSERQVMDMSVREAHQTIMPFFRGLVAVGDTPVKQYDTPVDMAEAWLQENEKTAKGHPVVENAFVKGVALTPHWLIYDGIANRPTQFTRPFTRRLKRILPPKPRGFTFCQRSTPECRSSCLMHSGQNSGAFYNTQRKAIQAATLLREPVAFFRMLVAAIEKHVRYCDRNGKRPFIRLNILSDLPWEWLAPWMFRYFRDIEFYDYTKLTGRRPPENYSLTFSYSGTPLNIREAKAELRNGTNVAVVFFAWKRKDGVWIPFLRGTPKNQPLPLSFWGYPIVDGDLSDVRSLDPSPAVVGLRWKSISAERGGTADPARDPNMKFVTHMRIVRTPAKPGMWGGTAVETYHPYPETGYRGNPEATGEFMIAPVTPRHEGVNVVALPWEQ